MTQRTSSLQNTPSHVPALHLACIGPAGQSSAGQSGDGGVFAQNTSKRRSHAVFPAVLPHEPQQTSAPDVVRAVIRAYPQIEEWRAEDIVRAVEDLEWDAPKSYHAIQVAYHGVK